MKIQNGHLEGVLTAMMDVTSNRMPGALAWRIVKVKREIAERFATVNEARDGLIKSYSGGDKIDKDHPEWGPFVKAFEDLMLQESEIVVEPFKVSELTANGCEFKPDSLGLLNFVGLLEE